MRPSRTAHRATFRRRAHQAGCDPHPGLALLRLAQGDAPSAAAAVRRVRRSRDGRTVQLSGHTLHVVVSGQTSVEVVLTRPVTVTLPRDRTELIGVGGEEKLPA